jgi:hypothetical protein
MMKHQLSWVLGICLISAMAQASQVIESEEHYVRGLRDRTGLITQLNTLAQEKSATASIKTFAKRSSDEYVTSSKQIVEIAAKLEIAGVGNMGGAPGGARAGGDAAGGAPGNRAGGAPNANGGAAAGAAPAAGGGGAQGRGAGPQARNKAVMDAMSALSGEAFDKAYLEKVLQLHEEIERNVLGEMLNKASNSTLVKWSGDYVIPYARNASIAQSLLTGQGDGNPPVAVSGSSPEAANRKGPTIEQMLPGQLFGITIGVVK